jgi:hypothetical protein
MGGVLDDGDAQWVQQVHEPFDLDRQPGEVDGHDGPRLRGDGREDRFRCRVERACIDVDEDRSGAEIRDHFGACCKGPRRNDHLMLGADADAFEREMQRGRRRVEGDGMSRAHLGREHSLEFPGTRSRRQPSRIEDIHHRALLPLGDGRPGER